MKRETLILVERGLAGASTIERAVVAMGGRVVCHAHLREALDVPGVGATLVLASLEHLLEAEEERLPLERLRNLCVVGDGRAERSQLARLLRISACEHLVLSASPHLTDQVALMMATLLRGQRFGLEQYLQPCGVLEHASVCDLDSRSDALASLALFLTARGQERRMIARTQSVVDELLCNALLHTARPPGVAVELRYGTDGRRIGWAVGDAAGALQASVVRSSLARCWQGGPRQLNLTEGGAGLGLFMAHQQTDQLVFQLSPGRLTQVIGIIDTERSQKNPQVAGSIHIYASSGDHEPAKNQGDPP